jgi:hypothetical protein
MEIWRWVKCQWDRVAAFVAFVVGLVALLLGWIGISGATLPSQQIPYLASDTVLGLFALGTAATLWLSADLRDEWRVLDDIREGTTAQDDERAGPVVDTFPDTVRDSNGALYERDDRLPVAAHGRAER